MKESGKVLKCSVCSSPLKAGKQFCSNCGARVTDGAIRPDTSNEEAFRKEKRIFALLVIDSYLVSLTVILLNSYVTTDQHSYANWWSATLLILSASCIIYATVRIGMFLDFSALQFTIAIILTLIVYVVGLVYMIAKITAVPGSGEPGDTCKRCGAKVRVGANWCGNCGVGAGQE